MCLSHGITKGGHQDLRPLPEKADEPSAPYDDPHETYIQLSPEHSEVFSSSTGESSPTNGFFSDSISSSLGTGITGRSSVYSWGIDDVRNISKFLADLIRCLEEVKTSFFRASICYFQRYYEGFHNLHCTKKGVFH